MIKYFVGLDLGKSADYTALSPIEKIPQPTKKSATTGEDLRQPARYNCVNLHRYPLGTSYTDIVEKVGAVLATPELKDNSRLVVDSTGCGMPVVDMFREAGLSLDAVAITGGHQASCANWLRSVPKRVLVSTLKKITSGDRLHVAAGPFRDVLQREMGTFDLTLTEAANDTYEGRKGAHDDLVLSVALAAWKAETDNFEFVFVMHGRNE